MNKELLKEYASLAVNSGASVQKGQFVIVNSPVACVELTRLIVEEAYKAGAAEVTVNFSDDIVSHHHYQYQSVETLSNVPEWLIGKYQEIVDRKGALIAISAPTPGLMKDIDPKKMQQAQIASSMKMKFFQSYQMSEDCQWSIVAMPTTAWATKVFPELSEEEAYDALLDAILKACRVGGEKSAVDAWNEHMDTLATHNDKMNAYNFKSLHFENSLGTNLTVGLAENHIWAGGAEHTGSGVRFAPNIPTEECFTMPSRLEVEGVVYSSKPLNYSGNLIKDFHLKFEKGKVVEYAAKEAEEALKSLIEFDEGSCYLGEVALVPYDSPISNSGILFLNTLFDENASCHLALGRCYPMNIKDGTSMSEEELLAKGGNNSMTHVDFMFGTSDMKVVGTTHDGKEVTVMEHGNFVI